MYARKDIPTVLPDAVLRCRKIQAASTVALDEMEKTKYRRINNIEWQQHIFQKTLTERHKRWRMNDRAFRIKLKRELGPDLATALRRRAIHEEEQKQLLEKRLIEESLKKERKFSASTNNDDPSNRVQQLAIEKLKKAASAHPKLEQQDETSRKATKSGVTPRPLTTAAVKLNQSIAASNLIAKLSTKRPKTSRFHDEEDHDAESTTGAKPDFGSVLLRILSDIAATPDLDDDFVIRKRALEARERQLITRKDNRYYNLLGQLAPPKAVEEFEEESLTTLY